VGFLKQRVALSKTCVKMSGIATKNAQGRVACSVSFFFSYEANVVGIKGRSRLGANTEAKREVLGKCPSKRAVSFHKQTTKALNDIEMNLLSLLSCLELLDRAVYAIFQLDKRLGQGTTATSLQKHSSLCEYTHDWLPVLRSATLRLANLIVP
jgi:hypothetical protein